MMIDNSIGRIRSYRASTGLSKLGLAQLAGINVSTIVNINAPDWNPTVSTLRKLESVIPPDFVPPEEAAEPERSPTMAKKPCGKGGRKK